MRPGSEGPVSALRRHRTTGISTGDFEEALAALVGKHAPGLSASTIARLKEVWSEECDPHLCQALHPIRPRRQRRHGRPRANHRLDIAWAPK